KLLSLVNKGDFKTWRRTERKSCSSQEKLSNRWTVVFSRTLASAGKDLKDDFLRALAELERANRSGKTTVSAAFRRSSVIFIRDYNPLGQEVSGYIDYAHRLKTEDFAAYFSGKKRLMPGRSDLCYYNWKTQTSTSNSSPNFEVVYEDVHGLLFKSKRDKKLLNVDPQVGFHEPAARRCSALLGYFRCADGAVGTGL
uniref:Cilia- and flagella-associated protein 299 n=1 Tax=Salarias fasciatus TaxID=181472 RepID=A0A672GKP0_SALFA